MMKTLQFGSAEQCLSFYYETINGKRVLGHSGDEKGATTEMYYDTSTNIGVIVFNNDDDAVLDNILTLLFKYGESNKGFIISAPKYASFTKRENS